MKIWGRANSINVMKVLWCADECGAKYERTDVGGAFGGNDQKWYLDMNPNGVVPTVDDGGRVIWESNSAVRFLAARYASGTLWPTDPGLRSEADRAAMVEGVASGVIDVIVSSHEPQGADTKRQPFASAAAGTVGLETLLPAALSLSHNGDASLSQVLAAMTAAPARIFGLLGGTLARGAPADLVLLDENEPFVVDAEKLHSRSRNTAFDGHKFSGRARATFVGGACVFDAR